MMTEYKLRKANITAEIASLEADYEEKVSEIEQKGNRSGELSMLESEIAQLQEIESDMEYKLRSWAIQNQSAQPVIKALLLMQATVTSKPLHAE